MRRISLLVLPFVAVAAPPARAVLDAPGFRAVPVAIAEHPVSQLAVAPDGRLFVAVQALGRPETEPRGTAEIRVYDAYRTTDGAQLDAGALWATVADVHVDNSDEGLLGIALAPDFATSGHVYVHVTTSRDGAVPDEVHDQEIRVYRETAAGTGEYVATVATELELASPSSSRNGGQLAVGVDGCLYLGSGDGGSGNRWSAQTLVGRERTTSAEADLWCQDVCLGTTELPPRLLEEHDGLPNQAGKILRFAVDGAAPATGGPGAPVAGQPFVFAAGLRDPTGIVSHPLTGQLFATDRGDALEAELDLVEPGANYGWPCLEGNQIVASCAAGTAVETVLANHPGWRRPLVAHAGSNEVVTGLAAYTGLAYPAEYYGDVFYLLRNGARIHRLDLEPPCFMPNDGPLAPLPFHDSDQDGDFRVLLDDDGDGDRELATFGNLMDVVQAPGPLGEVLYVVARRSNSGDMLSPSAIFRIEFATAFTPWAGPLGRVDASCFAGRDDPFARPACLEVTDPCAGGSCPGPGDCAPLEARTLTLRPAASGAVVLHGTISPAAPLAPEADDDVVVTLTDGATTLWTGALTHPDTDLLWRRKGAKVRLKDPVGSFDGVTRLSLTEKPDRTVVALKARGTAVGAPSGTILRARLDVGDQCFDADLRCATKRTGLRCWP